MDNIQDPQFSMNQLLSLNFAKERKSKESFKKNNFKNKKKYNMKEYSIVFTK